MRKRKKMWTIGDGDLPNALAGRPPSVRTLQPSDVPSAFQAIVDLKTKKPFAYEALVRCTVSGWSNPLGLFEQAVAESATGRLGRHIRESAFGTAPQLPIFVNLHPHELSERWLVRPDDPINFHPHQVFLEITESATLEYYDLCKSVLREVCNRTGAKLVVDDLGAGYSNLDRIVELDPAVVKLDRALVSGLDSNSRKQTLVGSITGMCHRLGATVVAEGIETADELRAVIDAGADYGQGYLFGRPAIPPPRRRLARRGRVKSAMNDDDYLNSSEPATAVTNLADIGLALGADRWSLTILSGESAGMVFPLTEGQTTVGRGTGSDLRLLDEGISRAHATFEVDRTGARLKDHGSTNGTFVDEVRVGATATPLEDGCRVQIGTVTIRVRIQSATELAAVKELYESSIRDPLTGVYNRRFLDDHLPREMAYARRHRTTLSVLMVDADHFKNVNDTYGHAGGDAVLVALGGYLLEAVRQEDIVVRYGGEEFTVLLRGVGISGASVLASRIRSDVENLRVHHEGRAIRLTVSIGVATFCPETPYESGDALVAAADRCLYRAKEAGRNLVVEDLTVRQPDW